MGTADRQWGARRRIARRRLVAAFAGAGVAGFLAACSGGGKDSSTANPAPLGTSGPAQAVDEPKRGGTLTVGIAGEPRSLDPHTGVGGDEHSFGHLVYDQIVSYDEKGQPDPTRSIAERWEQPDPLKVVLKLRPGITIQRNDEPVDGALVKWNLERAGTPGATAASDLGAIARVDVVNATEVVLNLKEPSASLLTNLGDRGGFILSRRHVEAVGKDAIIREPLGSGAFTLTRFISDASMTFERNPNYWRKDAQGRPMPYVDRIEMKVIPDATVRVAALETDEIDLSDTPSSDFKRLQGNKKLHAGMFEGSGTSILYINDRFPPMDNVWFRRAFSAALDRPNYINNFGLGVEKEARGIISPASWAYDESVQGYTYDVAKVREYLQRSGLPQSQWRVKVQPRAAVRTDQEEFYEAGMKVAGITLEWEEGIQNAFANKFMTSFGAPRSTPWGGNAAVLFSGWSMRVDPDGNCGPFFLGEKSRYNASQAPAPELEPMVLKGRVTLDATERKKVYTELMKLSVEHLYAVIPIIYTNNIAHASQRVGNLEQLYGGEGKYRWALVWLRAS
jgi:peptide/nickel transport system substrate-binding protein